MEDPDLGVLSQWIFLKFLIDYMGGELQELQSKLEDYSKIIENYRKKREEMTMHIREYREDCRERMRDKEKERAS